MLNQTITLEKIMHQWANSSKPTIIPKLFKLRRKWSVALEENWPDDIEINNFSSSLDSKVSWAESILSTWKTAHRTSWDTWQFDSKLDAEKFITIYHLTWA